MYVKNIPYMDLVGYGMSMLIDDLFFSTGRGSLLKIWSNQEAFQGEICGQNSHSQFWKKTPHAKFWDQCVKHGRTLSKGLTAGNFWGIWYLCIYDYIYMHISEAKVHVLFIQRSLYCLTALKSAHDFFSPDVPKTLFRRKLERVAVPKPSYQSITKISLYRVDTRLLLWSSFQWEDVFEKHEVCTNDDLMNSSKHSSESKSTKCMTS